MRPLPFRSLRAPTARCRPALHFAVHLRHANKLFGEFADSFLSVVDLHQDLDPAVRRRVYSTCRRRFTGETLDPTLRT